VVVGVGGYWGYPYYNPWWGFSPWYGFHGWYGYPGFYAPYGYGYFDPSSSVRLQVTPRETEVYVDGYRAGIVDDFDGVFQRLELPPGEHEIVLYLEGHRSVRQDLRLAVGAEYKIRHTMQPLPPGEPQEPRPEPPAAPSAPPAPAHSATPAPAEPAVAGAAAQVNSNFGTLAIRVQPADAAVSIDGEVWLGADAGERLSVQVSEGTHRVEIRKDGYRTFTAEVHVRRGEIAPLNVSLPRLDQ
jgi:hypothetical protein